MLGKAASHFNKLAVSVYKAMGFVILTAIVIGMVFYLTSTAFYLLNTKWIVPVILSPDNDKVVQARFQYLEYSHQLGKLEAELLEVKKQSEHFKFAQNLQKNFQENFIRALLLEKKRAGRDLATLTKILHSHRNITASRDSSAVAYGKDLITSLKTQLDQGLIGREEFLRSQQSSNQWVTSQISQQEKLAELENKADALQRNTAWLREMEGLSASSFQTTLLELTEHEDADMENLLKEQPLIASALTASDIAVRQSVLEKRSQYLEKIIADYRDTLTQLDLNPYVRASHSPVVMAFVPYDNLNAIVTDTRVIGCYLEFILCRNIGKVARVLAGEVTARHPMTNRDLRGQMVELAVADGSWTRSRTLLTQRPPFLF